MKVVVEMVGVTLKLFFLENHLVYWLLTSVI